MANHFPNWQLDHEREHRLQAVKVAGELEALQAEAPGHVIVVGDLDADPDADSIRFWTGRYVIDNTSVCYCSAWDPTHPEQPLATFTPDNPDAVDWDWPFRGIDHAFIRRGTHSGPTLPIRACHRIFDQPATRVGDH